MYNPYAQQAEDANSKQQQPFVSTAQPFANQNGRFTQAGYNQQQQQQQQQQWNNNMQIPQQQQQQQQQQQNNISGQGFNTFLNDPAAQMGLRFSQSAFNASQQYMQQNIKQFVSDENIKYYFKVSNSYVLKKLLLIVFPYRNKTWIRQFRTTTDAQGNSLEIYSTPVDDLNAPDLYIPSMALMTYILLWAVMSGINGDFHPQLLGYALTRTLAFYIVDILLLKISFYALSINSKPSKIWDLVSYSGYKFVTSLLLMVVKHFFSSYFVIAAFFLALSFSLGFFLMRSLRYVVLPSGMDSGAISPGSKRLRTQFLFMYSFVIQAVLVWLMA
ncbi:hypothetical protein BRETT_002397 [Brettanomyces bruxellensis]|uniref:Protein YIF1 n=1 Tax=Dekkera bruxellensis TaxID=5007 RepID=A0A871RDN1_DEKBR|nr:uncharacterized protein BRETT_002397 [Brettanomyces bruxellensis]QOU22225.1 hypothetical protein BRETT_002397 [Brettanomyces bruxellensis]